jgi:hypothetical protein
MPIVEERGDQARVFELIATGTLMKMGGAVDEIYDVKEHQPLPMKKS